MTLNRLHGMVWTGFLPVVAMVMLLSTAAVAQGGRSTLLGGSNVEGEDSVDTAGVPPRSTSLGIGLSHGLVSRPGLVFTLLKYHERPKGSTILGYGFGMTVRWSEGTRGGNRAKCYTLDFPLSAKTTPRSGLWPLYSKTTCKLSLGSEGGGSGNGFVFGSTLVQSLGVSLGPDVALELGVYGAGLFGSERFDGDAGGLVQIVCELGGPPRRTGSDRGKPPAADTAVTVSPVRYGSFGVGLGYGTASRPDMAFSLLRFQEQPGRSAAFGLGLGLTMRWAEPVDGKPKADCWTLDLLLSSETSRRSRLRPVYFRTICKLGLGNENVKAEQAGDGGFVLGISLVPTVGLSFPSGPGIELGGYGSLLLWSEEFQEDIGILARLVYGFYFP